MTATLLLYLLNAFAVLTVLSSATSNQMPQNDQASEMMRSEYKMDQEMFDNLHTTHYNEKLRQFDEANTNFKKNFNQFVAHDVKMEYKAKKRRNEAGAQLRVRRDDSVDDADPCGPFMNHGAEHKIYHPGHPGNYTSNIDCVTTIITIEGQKIKLDFRDFFELENASDVPGEINCTHDYLEVRDGQFGYNEVIIKTCGSKFPEIVESTGPYMWLRFHSDETLEYRGFHAEYEFVASTASKKQPQSCFQTVGGDFGVIKKDDINKTCIEEYEKDNLAVDVLYNILVAENWQILLNFTHFSLAEPHECKKNFIDVFLDKTEEPNRKRHFCGSVAETLVADTNNVYLRYYAVPSSKSSNFTAEYTAFRRADACEEDEWDCEDATCIKRGLKCDGTANCRLKADEDPEHCKLETESVLKETHIVIILVVFSLILSGMVIVFFYKCIRKLLEDQETIKEQIRQSREDGLDKYLSKTSINALKLDEPRSSKDNLTNQKIHHKIQHENHVQNIERSPTPERWSRSKSRSASRPVSRLSSLRSVRSRSPPGTCEVSVCAPDVKESGCQTRDSLFQMEPIRATDRVSPRPDSLSSFRPPSLTPQLTIHIVPPTKNTPRKIPPPMIARRPDSNETTRSAPDVIIVANPSP